MKILCLLCGIPGSGKSTFAEQLVQTGENIIWVSRDNIRFFLLAPWDEYFAKEKEVYSNFINKINKSLVENENCVVIADATHINENSRKKLLDRLNIDGVRIYAINFITPLNICLERNKDRKGRLYVPEKTIIDMYNSFVPANENEKYYYDLIKNIEGE